MTVLGARASAAFSAEADIHEWAQRCLLNPSRVAPEHRERPGGGVSALERVGAHAQAGLARLAELTSG